MSGSFSDSKLKPINHVYILAQQILLKSIIIEKCQRDDQQMLKVTFLLILDFWDRSSVFEPGWPQTHRDPFTSWVLG